jgi:hypothetical protein
VTIKVTLPLFFQIPNFSGWKVGDLIAVTTTDYSPVQTELFTIQSIIDSSTIQINTGLAYMHFGQFTFGADERAEVALFTRNVVITGYSEGALGGHMIFLKVSELVFHHKKNQILNFLRNFQLENLFLAF